MAKFKRRERRRTLTMPEVSLTPLIDTALTLLIIFMVTTPMLQNAIKVELPQGKAQEAGEAKQELVVYIDKDSAIHFNGKQMGQDELIKALQQQLGPKGHETVFVKADTAVHYGRVIQVVDQIKVVGGVQYVALATQKRA